MFISRFLPLLLIVVLLSLYSGLVCAQTLDIGKEPDVVKKQDALTYRDINLIKSFGFDLSLSNFGFGLGANYLHVIGPSTMISASAHLSVLRDNREQSLQTWFGELIPDKYNRVISIPVMVGLRQRVFSNVIDDNFKLFINAELGPSYAFIYPYFKDVNRNGIRDQDINGTTEIINDVFSGWREGYSQIGLAGLVAVGVDFSDRKQQLSIRIGTYFQYHREAIQLMEPYNIRGFRRYEPQHVFLTPMISFVVGKNWTRRTSSSQ